MPDSGKTAVIADAGTLETACPVGTEPEGFVAIPRAGKPNPTSAAEALVRRGVARAITINPLPGEGEALSGAGVSAVAWLADPFARKAALEEFTAVVATDARAAAAHGAPQWRLEPLPVADFLFARDQPATPISRIFFDGPTNEGRDRFLQPVKHQFDVLHLVGGAAPDVLADLIGRCQAAIDLIEQPGLPRRDRIGPAMAAGLLVLAQAPVERPGLVEGENLWTFDSPAVLELLISDALREPEAFLGTREKGRLYADRLRASSVLPRVGAYLD